LSIENKLWNELCLATAIGIIVDESTDIATESHIIVYVRYIFNGTIKIRFLSLLQIENYDAKSIYNAIIQPFVSKNGASVMQGKINGVAARMAQINPYIFTTHCIAHRLSLACEFAEKQVELCQYSKSLLKKVYAFFNHSNKRVQLLVKHQEILNKPILKIPKIFDIRWLSLYEAVNNFCCSIEPLLDTLLYVMTESKNQITQHSIFDLYSELCNWQTLAFLFFLQDILTELMKLCKKFQTKFLHFSDIYPIIQTTITKLEQDYLYINNNNNLNL
ncbi:17568_t:CDS:2, partial [Racocetra persica]